MCFQDAKKFLWTFEISYILTHPALLTLPNTYLCHYSKKIEKKQDNFLSSSTAKWGRISQYEVRESWFQREKSNFHFKRNFLLRVLVRELRMKIFAKWETDDTCLKISFFISSRGGAASNNWCICLGTFSQKWKFYRGAISTRKESPCSNDFSFPKSFAKFVTEWKHFPRPPFYQSLQKGICHLETKTSILDSLTLGCIHTL